MDEASRVRTGFGLKKLIEPWLSQDYSSELIERIKQDGHRLVLGDTTVMLAREFGFCYGVDRAIEYAYETVKRFPDRRIFLTGEIIHNPHVNTRLREMGVTFLTGPGAHPDGYAAVRPDDVVILPAFGVTVADLDRLARSGAKLVDTTCGSVLNVWKNVERYARLRMTSVVHGKFEHEETRATCSRVTEVEGGEYLVVRDMEETHVVADAIRHGCDPGGFLERFGEVCSPGFEPGRDLGRIGCANQTTMLSSESLAIAQVLRHAIAERYGEAELAERFRSFDTICSATQDRQDAVELLCQEGVDLMLVIGGYNSSNTNHLVEIASQHTRAYHIDDVACLRSASAIEHKPVGARQPVEERGWLGRGPLRVGVTSGASTPNSRVGEVIRRLLELRGSRLVAEPA